MLRYANVIYDHDRDSALRIVHEFLEGVQFVEELRALGQQELTHEIAVAGSALATLALKIRRIEER